MLDTKKTRQRYANFATELKKSKNNYLLTKGFNNDESAMVFVFTEQLPIGLFQTEIKVDKDLFQQLLTKEKNALLSEMVDRQN